MCSPTTQNRYHHGSIAHHIWCTGDDWGYAPTQGPLLFVVVAAALWLVSTLSATGCIGLQLVSQFYQAVPLAYGSFLIIRWLCVVELHFSAQLVFYLANLIARHTGLRSPNSEPKSTKAGRSCCNGLFLTMGTQVIFCFMIKHKLKVRITINSF